MASIQVESASFSYQPGKPVFTDVSFSLQPGEIFCIVGPNGCGKTTLLDCILGLHRFDTGTAILQGRDTRSLHPREMAAMVAYVPQRHTTAFPYSVLDVVLMGRTHATGMFESPNEADREQARSALRQVGLQDFAARNYTELSGGELQLVLIARALVQQAGLIIMDEPTAHLDFRHELDVMEIMIDLVYRNNLSILMTTHSINQAFHLENAGAATRVALMSKRGFAQVGSPVEVLSEENLREVFGLKTRIFTHEENGRQFRYVMALANIRPQGDT